jgi:hypothetical protein
MLYGVQRVDGALLFCAFIAIKIDKSGLEARKLWSLKVWGVVFQNFFDRTIHSLFLNPSKIP